MSSLLYMQQPSMRHLEVTLQGLVEIHSTVLNFVHRYFDLLSTYK